MRWVSIGMVLGRERERERKAAFDIKHHILVVWPIPLRSELSTLSYPLDCRILPQSLISHLFASATEHSLTVAIPK